MHSFLYLKGVGREIRCYCSIADIWNRIIQLCSVSLMNSIVVNRDLRCQFKKKNLYSTALVLR